MSSANLNSAGDLAYTWGFNDQLTGAPITEVTDIANTIGLSPTELTISFEPEFSGQATDSNGVTVANTVGPARGSFDMSGFVTCDTKLNSETFFWFDNRLFTVENRDISYSNTEYQQGSLSGVTYENVRNYCVGTLDVAVPNVDLTDTDLQLPGQSYLVTVGGTLAPAGVIIDPVTGAETAFALATQAALPGDYVYWNQDADSGNGAWVWEQAPCNIA